MAIRFRGTLADFSQLEYGYCPPGSIQLEEGDTLEGVIGQALRQSLPLFLLMAALTLVRLVVGMNWAVPFSVGRTFLVMVLWMVLYVVLIVVHEWIHALFFPRCAVKDVWFYRLQAAMVYCNTPVTRNRFIVMSLAPATILGIIPFIGWLLWGDRLDAVLSIAWAAMAWSMIFGGIGDFYNVRNVIRQVPKNAYVFNYGIHTYWIEDPWKRK